MSSHAPRRLRPVAFLCIATIGLFSASTACTVFAQGSRPEVATKTFRLSDGTQIPIQQWPDTYETLEWREPIDVRRAKPIVEYPIDSGWIIPCMAIDQKHGMIYWFAGSTTFNLFCARLDGSNQRRLIKATESNFEGPRGLLVVPEINKLFWSAIPYRLGGMAILQSDLAGQGVRPIIKHQHGISANLFYDAKHRQIYWCDLRRLLRANLDGTDETELSATNQHGAGFAIDVNRQEVIAAQDWNIVRLGFDGKQIAKLFCFKVEQQNGLLQGMFLDRDHGYLYWDLTNAIVRLRIDTPNEIEEVVTGRDLRYFTIDTVRNHIYWSADNATRLLCADLPPPWKKVVKSKPPEIVSFEPQYAAAHQSITLHGEGFKSAKKVIWIGYPTGEVHDGGFQAASDDEMTATVPSFSGKCQKAAIAIIAAGGATVTLPRDSTVVSKVLQLGRNHADERHVFIVRDGGGLYKAENNLAFIEEGGRVAPDLRGNNAVFVKNGARASHLNEPAALVVHEPHALIIGKSKRSIPVGAIRPSYVEAEFRVGDHD